MNLGRIILVGAAFLGGFAGVMVLFTAVLSAASLRARRLQELKEGRPQIVTRSPTKRAKERELDPAPFLTGLLQRSHFGRHLQAELLRAGLLLRPSEFLIISAIAAVTGLVGGWMLGHHWIFGLAFGALGVFGPQLFVKSKQTQRQRRISHQLPDALDMLASSLRAGHSLLRGMQVVVVQMEPPITEEFERVVEEVRLGQALDKALDRLVDRTGNYDLELVVSAVQIQLTIGGNLAEIFNNIAAMIRERVRLAGEIATATAEGRFSAAILAGLPFGMAFLINMVSPGYIAPLFHDPLGWAMLGTAGGLMLTGFLIIRKMLDIDL